LGTFLLLYLPPPCVFCQLPSSFLAVVVQRQVAHVKHVAEVHATYLSTNGFFSRRISLNGTLMRFFQALWPDFRADTGLVLGK
jgi:hypothetical protein